MPKNKTEKKHVVMPGQTWRDRDPRQNGRTVRVESVGGTIAACHAIESNRRVRIQIGRFGVAYELVSAGPLPTPEKKPAPNPTVTRTPIRAVEPRIALKMAKRKGGVSTGELAAVLCIVPIRAAYVLRKLRAIGTVRRDGSKRTSRYFAARPA
jgi:hypothetical protein